MQILKKSVLTIFYAIDRRYQNRKSQIYESKIMAIEERIMNRKRHIIECVNELLKMVYQTKIKTGQS